jgi:hypothetical protein
MDLSGLGAKVACAAKKFGLAGTACADRGDALFYRVYCRVIAAAFGAGLRGGRGTSGDQAV